MNDPIHKKRNNVRLRLMIEMEDIYKTEIAAGKSNESALTTAYQKMGELSTKLIQQIPQDEELIQSSVAELEEGFKNRINMGKEIV